MRTPTLRRKFVAAYAIAALVLVVAGIAVAVLESARGANALASQSYAARRNGERLLVQLFEAETTQRDYLLSGNATDLVRFRRAHDEVLPQLVALRAAVVRPDTAHANDLVLLDAMIARRLEELRSTADLREAGRDADAMLAHRDGRPAMAAVRAEIDRLVADESTSAAFSDRVLRDRLILAIAVIIAGGLSAFALATLLTRALRRDVDDLDTAKRSVEQHARALERVNAELDRFAAVASHDLRAPLRGIGNLCDWIEEDIGDGVTAQLRDHLAMLRDRIERMDRMVSGLLELARAGRERKTGIVDVGDLVRGVIDLVDPPADADIAIASDLPVIKTSKRSLEQVWLNLLANAIDHGRADDGRLRVELGGERDTDGWRFWVRDHGPGVPLQFHSRVFDIFETLRSDRTSTGIGLAVVKKLVEDQGGRVWIDPTSRSGARFVFTWPAAAITTAARALGTHPGRSPHLRWMR